MNHRFFKWAGWILLSPVLLFVVLCVLLYIPSIQNALKEKLIVIASESTGMQIDIRRVNLGFPLDLLVQDVSVVQQRDTLLLADELKLKVQFLPLLMQRIEIDKISLEGVSVNSSQMIDGMLLRGTMGKFELASHGVDLSEETVVLNKVSLVDTDLNISLTDTTSAESDTASASVRWRLNLHTLALKNIKAHLDIPADTLQLSASIGNGMIEDGFVDLSEQLYRLKSLKLSDCDVAYDSGNSALAKGFDPSHIRLHQLQTSLSDLGYHGKLMSVNIERFSLNERSGLSITSLKGILKSDSTKIHVPNLKLKTPYSFLDLNALIDWSTVDNPDRGKLSVLVDADFGKEDVMLFTGHLSDEFNNAYPFRPFLMKADVEGNLKRLNINELRAELPGAFQFSAHGSGEALLDSIRRRASLKMDFQTGNLDFLLALLENSDRDKVSIPHDMLLTGTASVDGKAYDANLVFSENCSRVELVGNYNAATDAYVARLAIDSLQFTDFLPKDSLYMLTAAVNVVGTGFDPFKNSTHMEADLQVDQFNYSIYDLSDVKMKASLANCKGQLYLGSHNPLLEMDTRLNALFQRGVIHADLAMDVWNADLHAARMTSMPFDLGIGLKMHASSNLNDVHCMDGEVRDIRMQVVQGAFQPKDIYFQAATDRNSSKAVISSGDFRLSLDAGTGMEKLLEQTTKLLEVAGTQLENRMLNQAELRTYFPNLCLRVQAGTDNLVSNTLTGFSGIDFRELFIDIDTSPEDGIHGNSYIYSLGIDSLKLDTVFFNVRQDTANIKMNAGVSNGPHSKQIVFRSVLDGEIGNDRAQVLMKYFNDKGEEGVLLGVRAVMRKEGMSFHFFPEQPTIVYRPFSLNKHNYIYVGEDMHVRANVSLLDAAGTGVRLYSLPCDTTVLQDMAVEIRRIELADVCEIAPYIPKLKGLFTTEAHLVQTAQSLQLAADVQIDDFFYEKNRVGDVGIEAVYLPGDGDDHHLDARLHLDGQEVLGVGGVYHASQQGRLDADVDLQNFPLQLANGFIPDEMIRLTGNMDGSLHVKGAVTKPIMNGELVMDEVSGKVRQYGVNFRLDKKPIVMKNNKLVFDKYSIYTRTDNPFIINGDIDLNDFSAMKADLKLLARNYELINAVKSRESLLYGKAFVDLVASIKGPLDALKMRGNINLLGNTNVTYVLTDSPLTAAQDRLGELVTFANFSDTTQVHEVEMPQVALGGMDMIMVVHIDQAARVNAELSADGSDYVRLEGGGDLSLQYTEYSGLQLTGRYTLTSGRMKYALIVGLSREFSIQNGSYVDFSGDPFNPKLNIIAVYKNRTSVTEDDVQRMVTFHASIALTNKLENLGLAFDLQAPEDGTIQNELAAMSDEERSRLAVTMIALGIYQGGGSKGFDMGSSMNSVLNSAIQGITNNIKAVDISLGVETGDYGGSSHTDYSYQISKRFWNDRFNIIIGGKFSTGDNTGQADQAFIDNISIEYRLDNSGTRYVRLFHEKNYDSILDGEITETGVGVVLRKKMSRLGELFIFRRNKKNLPIQNKEQENDEK